MNHPLSLTLQEISLAFNRSQPPPMPPPVPRRELGHSLGPQPSTVNLAAFLDYVVRCVWFCLCRLITQSEVWSKQGG